ncbi:MAG: lysoplasmalogenase [Clostridia bacterium]|nr:lysoplasmalogenase [Clostridia bacterium]
MQYIFLTLFFVAVIIHLYGSHKQNRKIRNYTKGFILFFLILFYIFSFENIKEISPVILSALICCWIGDLFLMIKGLKTLIIGGAFFIIGHILFIKYFADSINVNKVHPFLSAIFILTYIIIIALEIKFLQPHLHKKLMPVLIIYLGTNMTMNLFALTLLTTNLSIASVLMYIGAVSFFVSDSILFFVRFNKKSSIFGKHFWVMVTYSAAVFMLTLGSVIK